MQVWDNYHGLAAVDGDPTTPDPHCVQQLASGSNHSKAAAVTGETAMIPVPRHIASHGWMFQPQRHAEFQQ